MSDGWDAVSTAEIPQRLADELTQVSGRVTVAVDGPPCAGPATMAESLVVPLRARGRPVVHVRAELFWSDASLRLEHGHEDVESYRGWLDADALRRETLEPFSAGRAFLTSLRDPRTNRVTREPPVEVEPGTVLLISGAFLLNTGLAFDRTVHLHLPAAARARRTPAAEAWTLPAFETYESTVRPCDVAGITIRLDRRSPAVRGLHR